MAGSIPRPPTPPGAPYFGHLFAFGRDPIHYLARVGREYGDVVFLHFMGRPAYVVSRPELIEEVLGPRYRSYRKPFSFRTPIMQQLLGRGLVSSEGEFWVRQRRLAQPAFHRERIAAYARTMVSCTQAATRAWQAGDLRDVYAEMVALTAEIVVNTMFGVESAGETQVIAAALERIMAEFTRQFGLLGVLDNMLPAISGARFQRILRPLDDVVYRIIREKRAAGRDDGDLLSMLLHARDEDGTRMSDQQLRDETITFFFAGHETTAITLAWAWYLLAKHPEAAARLHSEVDTVLGDRPAALEDLPRLPFADHVIRESMRLYPPVWSLGREATEECEIDGFRIEPGAQVLFSQWAMHRDPRYWSEPETFDPDRWADGLAEKLPRCVYFPFGSGPRGCIGTAFAMMEAVLVLATLARRYRLSLSPGQQVMPWASMTLRPKDGLKMRVDAR